MSRVFGKVCQNGYVVRDIEAAMTHWIEVMGVGPWFYIEDVKTDWFTHRGQPSDVKMSIALTQTLLAQASCEGRARRRLTVIGRCRRWCYPRLSKGSPHDHRTARRA